MKRIISAVAVLAIVSGALAFKPVNLGTIYCSSSCSVKQPFQRDDQSGTITDPCDNGANKEFFLNGSTCTEITASGAKYISVDQ